MSDAPRRPPTRPTGRPTGRATGRPGTRPPGGPPVRTAERPRGRPQGRPSPRPTIDPRIRQRRASVTRRRGRRRLWAVVAVATVVVLGAAFLAVLHSPLLAARVVTVGGPHPHTPSSAIVTASGLSGRTPLIDVDPSGVASAVEHLPWVATATVTRHWPDRVTIDVGERVAALAMAGPGTAWSAVDATGHTLAVSTGRPAGLAQLIVVGTGGPVPPAPVGERLGPAAGPALAVATTLPPAFAGQVLAVTGNPDGTVDLGLNSGLLVHLGTATQLHLKYLDVAAILAHGDLHGKHVIDVSVPASPTDA